MALPVVSCASGNDVGLALGCGLAVATGLALGVVVAKSKARDFCVVSSLVRVVPVVDGADKCRRRVRTATGKAMPTINAMAAMGTTMTGRWYQTILYMYTVPVG
jgi:tetrahydromethanopterin S-methyltransferase subunit C